VIVLQTAGRTYFCAAVPDDEFKDGDDPKNMYILHRYASWEEVEKDGGVLSTLTALASHYKLYPVHVPVSGTLCSLV
jgi:hypothetical protein